MTALAAPPDARAQTSSASPAPGGVCGSLPQTIAADTLDTVIADAWRLVRAPRLPEALACFDRVLAVAPEIGTPNQEMDALIGAGVAERSLGRFTDSQRRDERALALAVEQQHATNEGRARRSLALDAYNLGQLDRARSLILEAKAIFERLNDRPALVLVYNNLMYLFEPGPEKDALREEALRVAREAKDRDSECGILHEWGDESFEAGDYAKAKTILVEALSCRESVGDPAETGRVLVSLGRVHRAHGRLDIALAYFKRAFELQDRSGDERAAIQSLNALAATYDRLGRLDDAVSHYQQALARASALGSTQTIAFIKGQIGGQLAQLGELDRAVPLLEESLRLDPRHRTYRLAQLAVAYARLDRRADALDFANQGVEAARSSGQDELVMALQRRAEVHRIAGRLTEAQHDLNEALTIVNALRTNVVATDYMKRGFLSMHQNVFSASIDLLEQRGRTLAALQTAEQARARAFLDLLATRSSVLHPASGTKNPLAPAPAAATETTVVAASTVSSGPAVAPAAKAEPATPEAVQARLRTSEGQARGGSGSAGVEALSMEALAETAAGSLASEQSVSAPTVDDVRATARRLKSTLVAYWVGDRAMHIWVVSPAGQVRSARVPIGGERLRALVASANMSIEAATAGLGSRGGQMRPWRELHQLLITPIRAYLPSAPDSLLTIIPHGPLFQVSFAALQDERGRYLLERYRLHYTPSVGVLAFTSARTYESSRAAGALLVGDPEPLPQEADEDPMPALPWARREVSEIGKLIAPERADIFTGDQARESTIRSRIEQADLLHFATHGVVRQDETFASFLALSDGGSKGPRIERVSMSSGSNGSGASGLSSLSGAARGTDDGRLTADEVYGLHLRARLVVLSACRTALGPLTGDGVIGFTRAFLYAGAASVVATNWNVPDESGYEVMRRFYLAKGRTTHPADALRTAQLALLASLRSGTITVETPGGPVKADEHPLYWAGFLVVGEP